MSETALQIVAKDRNDASIKIRIFLCHNSKDKPRITQIADALELDFGTPFFLDVYAIPTGQEFIPFIEQALATCSGCVIFLGANGWGPTHLWEAEQALRRYRADPQFKLLPAVLDGARSDDMAKLGAGRVFQDINWADFQTGADEHESLRKLEAAITGKELSPSHGPARLTPYQVRRDAARWEASGRAEKSILYRGKQFEAARRLLQDNPDFVVGEQIAPFLAASEARQRTVWRRTAIGGLMGTVIFLIMFIAAYREYLLAEARRLDSLSRALAASSQQSAGADRELLLSARAVQVNDTPDARNALMQQLVKWNALRRLIHLKDGVESIGVGSGGNVEAGTSTGKLITIDADKLDVGSTVQADPAKGAVTAVRTLGDQQWIGREDGSVQVMTHTAAGMALDTVSTAPAPAGKERQVLAIAGAEDGDPRGLVAVGTASGRLMLFERDSRRMLAALDEGDDLRITSLAFSRGQRMLAAGMTSEFLLLIDLSSKRDLSASTITRQAGIEGGTLALDFDANCTLAVVSAYGTLWRFAADSQSGPRRSSVALAGLPSSAAVDGKSRRIALGDENGMVRLYDWFGMPAGFEALQAHGNAVTALVFDSKAHAAYSLVSASRDGDVAFWNLGNEISFASRLPSFGPEPWLLRMDRTGTLIAASTTTGRAGVWRLANGIWMQESDLIAESRTVAGEASVDMRETGAPDSKGFQSVGDMEISSIAMDDNAGRVAWTTHNGTILLRDRTAPSQARVVTTAAAPDGMELAVTANALAYVERAGKNVMIVGLDAARPQRETRLALPAEPRLRSLAIDAQGNRVALGFENGSIRLFDAHTGRAISGPLAVYKDAGVAGLSFSDNGLKLISFGSGGGAAERTVAVISIPMLELERKLTIHQVDGSVSALAVNAPADLIAAGDHDGQVSLWKLAGTQFVTTLDAGSSVVSAILIDAAHERLVTVNTDGTFLGWPLNPDIWIKMACTKANRQLSQDEWKELLPDDPYQAECEQPAFKKRR